ncbi:MAG: glycosyltransferase [Microthrixaceae bacterium]
MNILIIATRQPYGRQTGRKTVLRTIIRSCLDLGHAVRVVAITDEVAVPSDVEVQQRRPPGLPRVGLNVLTSAVVGRLSLNECLYTSPDIRSGIAEICQTWPAEVVVADMLRTSSLALGTGLPTIVDLDDLLSRRYEELADGRADAGTVLGYYGSALPAPIRRVLATVTARLVGLEARLVARRERVVGRSATVVSLVAQEEARSFGEDIGRAVAWLPMAVEIPASAASVASNVDSRVVFVGGLDYHANLEAVRTYVTDVAPALARLGLPGVRLRVVGHCPPTVRRELEVSPALELLGYADDLSSELLAARAFIAPIPPGTGVKTKILEAMAAGLPVVSTPHGVDGIGAVDGEHCLVGASGAAMASALASLIGDPQLAARIGAAARSLVQQQFSQPVVTQRWREVLDSLPTQGDRVR